MIELQSTITCPECGFAREETMPEDACVFFYTCTNCGIRLRPKPGDCCVFCSYSSVPCPPCQGAGDSGPGTEAGSQWPEVGRMGAG
jgi:hypothetical protein